jgi:hypothetical protein
VKLANCCTDARDEIRKKTVVTFANPSPVMVQSASQDSLGSAHSQFSSGTNNTAGQDILRLSPGEEVTRLVNGHV